MVENVRKTSMKVLDHGRTSNLITKEMVKHLLMHVKKYNYGKL